MNLNGILVPMVTPFDASGELDIETLKKLTQALVYCYTFLVTSRTITKTSM